MCYCTKKRIRRITVFLAVIMMLSVIISCTTNTTKPIINPPSQIGDFVQGEIAVIFNTANQELPSRFIYSYTRYGLALIEHRVNHSIFSFHYNLVEGNALVEISLNDQWVHNAVLMNGWIHGELIAKLNPSISSDRIDDFIQTFSRYDLHVLSHAITPNIFRFSFDPQLVDEFEFRRTFSNISGVNWADFNGDMRQWAKGTFHILLKDDDFDSFMESYVDYNLTLNTNFGDPKLAYIHFDYSAIDEFYLFNLMENDLQVEKIDFSYVDYLTGGSNE